MGGRIPRLQILYRSLLLRSATAPGLQEVCRRNGRQASAPCGRDPSQLPIPPFQNPLSVEAEKKVSYNCCRQGTISLQIRMEKNTFAPGEKIVLTTQINNRTSKCLRTVVFALYTHVRYEGFTPKAEPRWRVESSELLRHEANTQITPFDTTTIVSTLKLPLVLSVSSRTGNGELMSTRYELVGTVHLPWSLTCVKAKVPITVASALVDAASCQPRERAALPTSQDCQP